MSGHTPGPWHQYRLDDRVVCGPVSSDGDEVLLASLYDGGKSMICTPGVYEVTNRSTAKANARLIAAAPDLLAACKAMLRVSGLTDSEPGYSIKEADDMARAAIAKATGSP